MEAKQLIWVFMVVGSTLGGFLPVLFGSSVEFSFASIIWGAVGGFAGIWLGYKLSR